MQVIREEPSRKRDLRMPRLKDKSVLSVFERQEECSRNMAGVA